MDAHKLRRIQDPFDIAKRLLLQIAFTLRAKTYVIVLGLGVIDLQNRDHMNVCAVTNQNPLSPGARRTRSILQVLERKKLFGLNSNSGAIQRFTEPVRAERFQQVIDCMNLKCSERVFVVCRHEDHVYFAAYEFQHFKAVQPWHLYIEKQQVRLEIRHGFYRFESIGTFRNDLDVIVRSQVLTQKLSREFFVIDYGNSHTSYAEGISHKKAQKSQKCFCDFCAFFWLILALP